MKKTKGKPKKSSKPAKNKKKHICERYNEDEMCYRCLDLSRELLLCGELDEDELKRVKRVMVEIISKRGVPREEVDFLEKLSEAYLN